MPRATHLNSSKSRVVQSIALVLAATVSASRANAQDVKLPALDEIVGSYSYAGDRAKDENAIKAKIKKSTAEMNFLVLRQAMPRLQTSTSVPQRIDISRQSGKAVFKMDDYVMRVPDNGEHSSVKTLLGEFADTHYDANKATLYQDVASKGSGKSYTFRFNPARQLMLSVRVHNRRLTEPITFEVPYGREK